LSGAPPSICCLIAAHDHLSRLQFQPVVRSPTRSTSAVLVVGPQRVLAAGRGHGRAGRGRVRPMLRKPRGVRVCLRT
jgi:hypothetical protein